MSGDPNSIQYLSGKVLDLLLLGRWFSHEDFGDSPLIAYDRDVIDETMFAPLVTGSGWGYIEIEGQHRLKDVKLYPGGFRTWDWRETGTGHSPGIQPADVKELLEHGSRKVILSRGRFGRLQVCPETLELLQKAGIEVEVLKTSDALKSYEKWREKVPVGALIHTTC